MCKAWVVLLYYGQWAFCYRVYGLIEDTLLKVFPSCEQTICNEWKSYVSSLSVGLKHTFPTPVPMAKRCFRNRIAWQWPLWKCIPLHRLKERALGHKAQEPTDGSRRSSLCHTHTQIAKTIYQKNSFDANFRQCENAIEIMVNSFLWSSWLPLSTLCHRTLHTDTSTVQLVQRARFPMVCANGRLVRSHTQWMYFKRPNMVNEPLGWVARVTHTNRNIIHSRKLWNKNNLLLLRMLLYASQATWNDVRPPRASART